MRSLLAVAVAVLWCNHAESAVQDFASSTPAFVSGAMSGQMSRKRPRGAAGVAAAGVPAAAMTGSFTAARLACGDGAWFGVAGERRRRGTQGENLWLVQLKWCVITGVCRLSPPHALSAGFKRDTTQQVTSMPPLRLRTESFIACSPRPICVLFPFLATDCRNDRDFLNESSACAHKFKLRC